jgi:dihydrofolate reductase
VDHRVGIADEEGHAHFTRLMGAADAMLWGRTTYEMMESYWPAVARGEVEAPSAIRDWVVALETKPKYVASTSRSEYPWTNSHHLEGDLGAAVTDLKDRTPGGVLLGSVGLAMELDRLGLIDEYRFLLQPMIAGKGPTLHHGGLPRTRDLDLVSAVPLGNGTIDLHYRRSRVPRSSARK